MIIRRFELKNFRGIEEMLLEFQPDINILSGINGAGKSSILDALAVMLSRLVGRICSTKGTGRFFTEEDIRNGQSGAVAQIEVLLGDKKVQWQVAKTAKAKKLQTITNLSEIMDIAEQIRSSLESDNGASIPIAVFYSVNRSVIEVPLRIRKRHAFDQIAAYDNALTGKRNDFRLFFEWFRNREDYENEMLRDNNKYVDPQLAAVRKAIEMFTGFKDVRVRRNPVRMETKKAGKIYDIRQLSDGEKCLLALIGDLARRLAIANPKRRRPLDGAGVVLIDEVDLHLHPTWQRMVVQKLTRTFPNCQFILTTHSPQVLGEVAASHIKLLHADTDGGIVYSSPNRALGLDASEVLEELMGAESRNNEIADDLGHIFQLIDDEKYDMAKAKIEYLQKKINGSIPELVHAQSLITMLT